MGNFFEHVVTRRNASGAISAPQSERYYAIPIFLSIPLGLMNLGLTTY